MTQAFASIKHAMLDYGSHSQLHMTTVSQPCIKVAWLSYLAIVSLAMVNWRSLPPGVYASMKSASVAVASVGMGVSLAVCGVMIAVVSRRRMRRSRGVVKGCIYMTIAFTYIVYPLTLRLMAEVISDSKVTAVFMVFAVIVITMGVFPAFCGTRLLKSQFPINKLFLSCDSRVTESLIYWIEAMMLVVPPVAEGRLSTFQSASLSLILSIIVGLTTVLCTWRYRVYWNQYTNILFATAFFCSNFLIFLISMKSLGLIEKDSFWYTTYFALVALYGKIMANRTHTLAFVDLLISKTSDADFKQACYYFEQSWVKLRDGSKSKLDHKLYAFYYGSFLKGVYTTTANGEDDSNMDLAEREMHMLLKDFHFELMQYIHENRQSSKELMDLLLYLMLGQTMQSLSYSFISLKAYKRSIAGHFFGELDYAFLQLAFEVKLSAIYKGKIKDDSSKDMSLRDSISMIWNASRRQQEDNYLDIHLPIRAAHHYERFCKKVLELAKTKKELFECLTSSQRCLYSKIFEKNKEILNTAKDLDVEISEFEAEVSNRYMFVGYFYCGILVYLKDIRYNLQRVKKVFKSYRLKRQLLMQSSSKGIITEANLFKEGVVLEASLQQESLGQITDHTIDYSLYFGTPSDGSSIKGKNINKIMLHDLQKQHFALMQNSYRFMPLNSQRSFFILGFDDEIYEVRFLVKIVPMVSECMRSLVYLRRIPGSSKNLTVVDKNMNIIGCHKTIQTIYNKSSSSGASIKNLKDVSTSLCNYIQLLRAYRQMTDHYPRSSEVGDWSFIKKIAAVFDQIDHLNKVQGMNFDVNDSGPCADVLDGFILTAKIDLVCFMRNQLAKVYIRFNTVDEKFGENELLLSDHEIPTPINPGTMSPSNRNQATNRLADIDIKRQSNKDRLKIDFYIRKLCKIMKKHKLDDKVTVAALDDRDRCLRIFIDCLNVLHREIKIEKVGGGGHRKPDILKNMFDSKQVIKERTGEEEESPVRSLKIGLTAGSDRLNMGFANTETQQENFIDNQEICEKNEPAQSPLVAIRKEIIQLISNSGLNKHNGTSIGTLNMTFDKNNTNFHVLESSRQINSIQPSDDLEHSNLSNAGFGKKFQVMGVIKRQKNRKNTFGKKPLPEKDRKPSHIYKKMKDGFKAIASANFINRLLNTALVG